MRKHSEFGLSELDTRPSMFPPLPSTDHSFIRDTPIFIKTPWLKRLLPSATRS